MFDGLDGSPEHEAAHSEENCKDASAAPSVDSKRGNEPDDDQSRPPFSASDLDLIRSALKPEQDEDRRFTLTGLFALVTFASVVLALGRYLPRPIFAGVTGLATLVGMAALSLIKGPPMVIQLGWWLLLSIYLLAIGWAVWG